ncbi:hypothetical protein N7471_007746 [Penicillium samsonianum]|uniref:uncharacterized protein n=1 Tax=Penicillium samsonianum TaxID=1882272 RepID=UPI002546CB94|nr:uncharacterized protein N7471_007746 [Penicillium samsonianum]KAJ6132531.1 hypothetical protein N7471_007746 [Penicillium samsonianum]
MLTMNLDPSLQDMLKLKLVFNDHEAQSWSLKTQIYIALRFGSQIRKSGPIPAEYDTAYFIKGAIPGEGENVRGRCGVPVPSAENQLVTCKYEGGKALSDSLELIIFVGRT